MKRIAISCLLICACGDEVLSTRTGAPTFEEWRAGLTPHPKTGWYTVDGDIPLHNERELRAFYDRYVTPNALTLNVKDCAEPGNAITCVDDVWSPTQKLQLTYCVSASFGSRYNTVVQAMHAAENAWESSAFVEFTHLAGEDGDCDDEQVRTALFPVVPISGGGFIAQAFFPSSPPAERVVFIDDSAFSPTLAPVTLTGVLRHELGHVLGFRHEHIRIPQSGSPCLEPDTWQRRDVTVYDRGSVMHYPHCGGYAGTDPAITQLDRIGASMIYGPVNRVIDPGFEMQTQRSPVQLPWWTSDPAVGIDLNLGYQANGRNNAYAAVWYGGWHAIHQTVDVAPNKLYLASANLRTSANVSGGYFSVRDMNWNLVAEVNFGPATSYAPYSYLFDSGANTRLYVYVGYWAPNAWSWIQIDDVELRPW